MQQRSRRIAIQLYGHLRSFEQTYRSLFKHVIEPNRKHNIEFDLFIHTWDEFDAVQKTPSQYNKDMRYAGKKLPDIIKNKVLSVYKPKAFRIEPQIFLTGAQAEIIRQKNFDPAFALCIRNTCHTFCEANKLRRDYEIEHGVAYDLVIVTRPDIIFYRPLDLGPFYNTEKCWQYFEGDSLNSYIFSAYINGVHSVICPDKYIAGLDLILMGTPAAMNKLGEWENVFDELADEWPEYALIKMMKRQSLKHSFFIYEKDKCWTIIRLGAKAPGLAAKLVGCIYRLLIPMLLKSRLYCQHTYTNVTTMPNRDDFKAYLQGHLDLSVRSPATRFLPSRENFKNAAKKALSRIGILRAIWRRVQAMRANKAR